MDPRAAFRPAVELTVGLILWASTATAATHVIRPDGTGDFPTIQAAIDAAVDGDIVELTDGTFTGPGNKDIEYHGKAIAVKSQSGNPRSSIIDCEAGDLDPHRGFNFAGEGGESVLEGITITNGWGAGDGGGIACVASSPTIRNCTVTHCRSAGAGGGIVCKDGSSPTIVGCAFQSNMCGCESPFGGGMACRDATPLIEDCVVAGNFGDPWPYDGGGIWLSNSSAVISRCIIDSNLALGGGGMLIECSTARITGCEFKSNAAETGGAIDARGGASTGCSLTIESCCFTGNMADPDGECGGIVASGCDLTITGCVFARNGHGGAIWSLGSRTTITGCTLVAHAFANPGGPHGGAVIWSSPQPGETDRLATTIIAFNEGPAVVCDGAPVAVSCCDVFGNLGGDWVGCIADQCGVDGNICEDPLFCDAANEDFTLAESSPCAPFSPPNPECNLVGALPVGCGATAVESTTWGSIKAVFAQ